MPFDRRSSHETKLAMFWAAVAAECAGEKYVTASRTVASLLRTNAVIELCSRAQIDSAHVRAAVDDPQCLSFEECERKVKRDLADKGLEFLSNEHRSAVELRRFEPAVERVFDAILERHGRLAIPPLELLGDVIGADPALAQRLAAHGLTARTITTLGENSE